ncbi:MAG TPA: amidohydrolase [bacterium]|nr:amidohydrolase [bacterium]
MALIPKLIFMGMVFLMGANVHESHTEPAGLVLRNGKIVTMDPARPVVSALAVRDGILVALGSEADIQSWIGPQTRVIGLEDKLAIPGFIEGHAHFMSLGNSKMILDLSQVKNWDDVIGLVAESVKQNPPGTWILGRGWHQEKWDRPPHPNIDGCPTHGALSAVSPDHPVLLTHASGHMCFANAEAMRLAGITAETPTPAGGELLRDSQGNPTGIFREEAQSLVNAAYERSRKGMPPHQIQEEWRRQVERASAECLSKGITSFHDAGSSFAEIDFLKSLALEGKLKLRLWIMIGESNERLKDRLSQYRLIDFADHHLTVRAVKRFIDGALGSHTAWMLEPYADLPGRTGVNTEPVENLQETARLAMRHDFQLGVHAIGDRANREVLNLYESVFRQDPDRKDRRWRIEHAQHVHPADIPRFGALGVTAAMQGCHATSDGPYVVQRLGEQRAREGAYAWRAFIDSGAVVVNGSDAPVEDVDPLAGFYASVTRRMPDGRPFFPEQCMTREEALRSYTWNAAYAAFEEKTKGSLAVGKLADITVLSQDILTVPEEEILQTKVLYTILGGQVLYENTAALRGATMEDH